MLQLRVLSYICSRRLSPTTSPLHVLEGPRRHVEHLPSDHLLSRSGLCLATPSVCCSRMQTGVSVHCTLLSYSAARCSCSSGVSVRCSCLTPCSMLKAGVGTKYRGTPHRLPVSVASAWPALSLALQAAWNKKLVGCPSGLPKIINEALSVVADEQFPSAHQWFLVMELLKTTCKGAHQIVTL